MSSQNLETVRQQFDHWNRGDLDSMGIDRVLVGAEWRATGEVSGIQAGSDWSVLYILRSGCIVSVRFFYDRREALASAGFTD